MPFAAAVVADAGDDQAVAGDAEVVLLGYGVADVRQFFAAEFDQLVAHLAVEMVVLRVAVVVLVNGPAAERHLPQQARFDQLVQRAIDRGPADFLVLVLAGVRVDEFIGIEMVVTLEDEIDQRPPLLRGPLAAALQILLEPLLRRERDLDFAEGEFVGHWGEVGGQRSEVGGLLAGLGLIETGASES